VCCAKVVVKTKMLAKPKIRAEIWLFECMLKYTTD
jgi:hypothetical protein